MNRYFRVTISLMWCENSLIRPQLMGSESATLFSILPEAERVIP